MTKVVSMEDTNYNEIRLKRMALRGVATLLMGTSLFLSGCSKPQEITDFYEDFGSYYTEGDIINMRIDDINLLIVSSDQISTKGYTLGPYGVYYKLTVDNGVAPEGYSLDFDGETIHPIESEIKYEVPEGYILIGDKIVSIVPREIMEELGYEIEDDFVVFIEEAILKEKELVL